MGKTLREKIREILWLEYMNCPDKYLKDCGGKDCTDCEAEQLHDLFTQTYREMLPDEIRKVRYRHFNEEEKGWNAYRSEMLKRIEEVGK